MKQFILIDQIKEVLSVNPTVETAFLYGSFARKTPSVNSDIDIATVVSSNFIINNLINELENHFSDQILKVQNVKLRSKIVLYFNKSPKVEITFSENIKEYERNYLGSEIPIEYISDSILFDKSQNALFYLQKITNAKNGISETDKQDLLDKFVYEYESCSNAHRRSDGYHFYYFYNIALHTAIQLNHLDKGETKFNFLPKNFITNTLTKDEQNDFYGLKGTLFLPEANSQKRKLLNFFYGSIQNLVPSEKLTELKSFCETIYDRDFQWNFRDISLHNPKIKSGVIYRTATLTLFQNETFFNEFISENNIKTVIDLRADREVAESNYTEESLKNFKWIQTPFDPWNQSIDFQATHHQGSNIEIAYRFFAIECKDAIKKAIEVILEEDKATAIHCYAGKDRTGIIISMLHLLSGADMEDIYNDYLATEMDTKKEYLDIVLNLIKQDGGIENYFLSCNLSQSQINKLKDKILIGQY